VRTLSPSDRSFELEVVGLEHHLFGVISYVKFRNKSALIEAFQEKIQQVLDAAQIPKNDQPVITVENNYLKWIPNKVKYVDNMNILSQIMGFKRTKPQSRTSRHKSESHKHGSPEKSTHR